MPSVEVEVSDDSLLVKEIGKRAALLTMALILKLKD